MRDGYICPLVHTDKHWRSFFAAIGQPVVFENDKRFSSQSERLAHKSTDIWPACWQPARRRSGSAFLPKLTFPWRT
ncbi:hypothetical protein FJV43_29215 [Bradyrhizobium sp. I71]|nr:hypothetical protein FJV43_29215 [Bradyrhizobium sp. I71]